MRRKTVIYSVLNTMIVVRILFSLLLTNKCSIYCSDVDADVWNDVFNERSDKEWKDVWHSEKHRRCYQDLESHMKWVCLKDIYKVRSRRNDDIGQISDSKSGTIVTRFRIESDFLNQTPFNMFTGKSRRKRRGIMDECCVATTGCSWEEYAEYCTHNNRVRL
ncbi:putative insulin-like peptide 7 [Leptotrombidium deliense]|uniref:Putative insulin-like peptide 7 n=1 Tax=Leptotrombidium deliense TaxID=299467 RepID=A0A443SIY4_9ACAR|nr:putative insulin-like peptide 7 [Leptotrombidium deliense]